MKIFGKKKQTNLTTKQLEKQIADLRREHSLEMEATVSSFEHRIYGLRYDLNQQREQTGRAMQAANTYAELVRKRDETIAIVATSIDIERVELQARADRATMRLKGLGV
jgi:hypothetical protein